MTEDLNHIQCDWPECHRIISWKMAQVTMNRYKRILCVEHQIAHVKFTYENMPKLRDMALKNIKERFGIV